MSTGWTEDDWEQVQLYSKHRGGGQANSFTRHKRKRKLVNGDSRAAGKAGTLTRLSVKQRRSEGEMPLLIKILEH